jgi:hypothetical protein
MRTDPTTRHLRARRSCHGWDLAMHRRLLDHPPRPALASSLPRAEVIAVINVLPDARGDSMLAIYDTAAKLRPGRAIVDSTVNLAVRGLRRTRRAHPRRTVRSQRQEVSIQAPSGWSRWSSFRC